jgi:hypothetical protein
MHIAIFVVHTPPGVASLVVNCAGFTHVPELAQFFRGRAPAVLPSQRGLPGVKRAPWRI